jgi:ATP-dependent protease ClpP protease subunit
MKLPIIQLPARPKGLRFEVSAVADPRFKVSADTAQIEIFDVIAPFGVSDSRVAAALRTIGPRPISVLINSPGGDAFMGMTIYNLFRAHGHQVTIQILGIAASAACIIAMAGDRIEIAKNAQGMIHRAQAGAYGDADWMRTIGVVLDKLDTAAADLFQVRTGLPLDQVKAMMSDETYMDADEMISFGFADALLDRDAEPAPKALAAEGPQNIRDLETQLRTIGLSKNKAARAAAAAWPALSRDDPPEFDLELLAARIEATTRAVAAL